MLSKLLNFLEVQAHKCGARRSHVVDSNRLSKVPQAHEHANEDRAQQSD